MFWKHYDNYLQHVQCLGVYKTAIYTLGSLSGNRYLNTHFLNRFGGMSQRLCRLSEPSAARCSPGMAQRPGQRRNVWRRVPGTG